MTLRHTRTARRQPLRLLAVGALLAGASACGDGPLSPSAQPSDVAFGAVGADASAKATQVPVCHRTGAGTYVPLTINGNALATHQAHGDVAPGAAVPDLPGATFDADCVPGTGLDVSGTYVLQTVNGEPLPAVGNDEMLHGGTIVLAEDGSCSFRVQFQPDQDDPDGEVLDVTFTNCSYSLDGTELTMEMIDERDEELTLTATLSDGAITIHDDVAGDIVFVKE